LAKKIKLFDPVTGIEEEKSLIKVLKSHSWASGAGTGQVKLFEERFKEYLGSGHLVGVSNGTAALHLALSLFDIKNKEVILPSLSFVSTAHAVLYNGGIPIFADIDESTLNIDPVSVDEKITKNTRVILPVHFGGLSSNIDQLQKICNNFTLSLVEDAAHASGSTFKGKKIGTHGQAVCFSFHPVKNLAMPSGGAISLNGKNISEFRRILESKRWCGITNRHGSEYDISMLGWNYYMNEFSAAIGIEQLKKLDRLNSIRKKIAKRYTEELIPQKMPFSKECSYHLFWIRVKNRESFMKNMSQNGIETGIHYNPIHKMSFYKSRTKLPLTEKVSKELVSIPIHPNLSESDLSKIIKSVNKFM